MSCFKVFTREISGSSEPEVFKDLKLMDFHVEYPKFEETFEVTMFTSAKEKTVKVFNCISSVYKQTFLSDCNLLMRRSSAGWILGHI